MSDAVVKRDRRWALADAHCLRALLAGTWARWEVAGSLRRGSPTVGDVDHVLIPSWEERPGPGLFGEVVTVNRVWATLDRLVEEGVKSADLAAVSDSYLERHGRDPELWQVSKAIRETKAGLRTCWGERQRSVVFRGCVHELYLAEPATWGSHLLIRTGPADFSRWMVSELRRYGFKHEGGRVIDTRKVSAEAVVEVAEESVLFDLVQIAYREPVDRRGNWPDNREALAGESAGPGKPRGPV